MLLTDICLPDRDGWELDYDGLFAAAGHFDERVQWQHPRGLADFGTKIATDYAAGRPHVHRNADPAEQGGNTPAVALTAYARSEDRLKVILAGFQTHMAKPVEAAELLALVASLAGRVAGREK